MRLLKKILILLDIKKIQKREKILNMIKQEEIIKDQIQGKAQILVIKIYKIWI